MANRRMFSKNIVESDRFLDLSLTSQALYFHLGMVADDDGFVGNPRGVIRLVGAKETDLATLVAAGFVGVFESGVVVVLDWKENNYLRNDRYRATVYADEYSSVAVENNRYVLPAGIPTVYQTDTNGIPNGYQRYTQDRLGKDRIGKDREDQEICASAISAETPPASKSASKFVKPSIEEVRSYCREKGYTFSPEAFVGYYESNGWKVGKNPMKSWKGACASWQSREGPRAVPESDEPTFERDGYIIDADGRRVYQYANGERDANGTIHVHFD